MELNQTVVSQVKQAQAQLLVVTKYYDKPTTLEIIKACKANTSVIGWGENRTSGLTLKALPRAQTHFIGRLQSRQLPVIVEHCETIHSLASLKHAAKINAICEQNNYSKIKVYIQVNVAGDPSKEGITPEVLPDFLKSLAPYTHLNLVGLSSMGWGEFEVSDKIAEFKNLIQLRDTYIPKGLTSAGTSRDYQIALAQGINVVRVGQALLAT